LIRDRWTRTDALVATLVLGLTAVTVFVQYRALGHVIPHTDSVGYEEFYELGSHRATLHGTNVDPWVYRILSEWAAEPFLKLARALAFEHWPAVGFVAFRALQNVVIFSVFWLVLRRFGFGRRVAALGMGLLAFAMTQALHDSGLAFNTYTDLAVYLIAAALILDRRYEWVVPLMVVGALNRETSGLIPVMLIAVAVTHDLRTDLGRRALRAGIAALAVYAVVTVALRLIIGSAPLFKPMGLSPGGAYAEFNLRSGLTWEYLARTLTIVPFVALAGVRRWSRELKAFALAIVPAWLVIHLFASILAESRLLLVPYAVVFVPGALFLIADQRVAEVRSGGRGSAALRV
jgi:hypothetical protein